MRNYKRLLGILGGMGPAATLYFIQKILEKTDAKEDQDHVPYILYNFPQIPDRTNTFFGTGLSPLNALV